MMSEEPTPQPTAQQTIPGLRREVMNVPVLMNYLTAILSALLVYLPTAQGSLSPMQFFWASITVNCVNAVVLQYNNKTINRLSSALRDTQP
jgi:hypothetical protein